MAQNDSTDKGGIGWKAVAAITVIVLAGGLILAGWIATRFDFWPGKNDAPLEQVANKADSQAQAGEAATDSQVAAQQVAAKVEQLEKRLEQIDKPAATSTSGYAFSQGAVAAALRARRLSEDGKPLGFVENQLGLHFGDRHPDAVGAIRAFAQSPISFDDLGEDLVRAGDAMIGRGGDAPLWDQMQRELSTIFKIRKRGEPSSAPTRILQRAQEAMANGDLEKAISAVSGLPANDATRLWLSDAGRYMQMKKALDILEQAALSVPSVQSVIVSPSGISVRPGERVQQQATVQPLLPPIPPLNPNGR